MLGNETWNSVSLHQVILDFIRSEPRHWRRVLPRDLHYLIQSPDLGDGTQNSLRWRLLHTYRRQLMGEVPPDTVWYKVQHLKDAHLSELHVIARCGFFSGPTHDLPSVAQEKKLKSKSDPTTWLPPILWGHDRGGPFTILEGNHRLTAYANSPTGQLCISAYIGLSSMPCYWHGLDPPLKLVHDMWETGP